MREETYQAVTFGTRVFVALLVTLAVIAVVEGGEPEPGEGPVSYELASDALVIRESADAFVRYRRQGSVAIEGRAVSVQRFDGTVSDLGMRAAVVYLLEDAYHEAIRRFGRLSSCPATFSGRHMKVLILLGGDAREVAQIERAAFSEGQRFTLRGERLGFQEGRAGNARYGRPVGRFRIVRVESLIADG